jgi:hypothetical protein
MSNIIAVSNRILPMKDTAIEKVTMLSKIVAEQPQTEIPTTHIIHGGMYSRTIFMKAGTIITGALIKVPTILIFQGCVVVYIDDKPIKLEGYNVFAASAHRKQAIVAITDVNMTMIFPTEADNVLAAEKEFTDEYELLLSHIQDLNTIIITGE